jgi:hypothetical protein
MRPIQAAALAVLLLVGIQAGCQSETPQEICLRRTNDYCAERGGCSEFLRAMEMRGCVAEASVAARKG